MKKVMMTISSVSLFYLVNLIAVSLSCNSQGNALPESQRNPPSTPPPTPSTCGHSIYYNNGENLNAGIVGGQEAKQFEYPWLVRLRIISGSQNFLCGGVLVNRQWVLTAGHCTQAAIGDGSVVAVFGDYDRTVADNGEVSVAASRIVFHPNYNPTVSNDYDIALIKLSQPVSYSGAIQPICLPTDCANSACQNGEAAWITGWGTTQSGSVSGTNILRKAWVPIVSKSVCQSAYSRVATEITDQMICAGFQEGKVDTCQGDSGGPLICNVNGYWELGGITSFGQGCGTAGFYGVYTKVCTVMSWITSTMAS